MWRKLLILCVVVSFFRQGHAQSATATSPASPPSRFRLVRSVSGASGHEENGRYIMDDPRSVFTAGKDTKVTVYFEWEGPLGPHHFEGLWKSPEGKIVLISDFRYEAKTPRFSGYWSLLLADTTPSGEWNVEARIDGEPAGTHSFVITGSPTASIPATPQPLGSADLYQKAMDATVTIAKLGSNGSILGKGSGFWVGDGRILTAFDVIDGASSLRILRRDGSEVTTDQILAWNRWQDWALLKVEGSAKTWLKRGSPDAPKVGDRCVVLEFEGMGARLADGSITGKNVFPRAGERLLLASGITPASFGGPLLDEYGNFVGIVGGNILPGGDPMKTFSLFLEPGPNGRPTKWDVTGMATPQALLPELSSGNATRLADLASRGEFLSPMEPSKSIFFATLTSMSGKDGANSFNPTDYRNVFSHRDGKAVLYVSWKSLAKEKLNCVVRLFDADNKPLSESKSREVSLAPGKYAPNATWDISLGSMSPGVYRVDLVLNGQTAWRDFLRITD
jgi:hypothetical protein